jgi:hypothetical protein
MIFDIISLRFRAITNSHDKSRWFNSGQKANEKYMTVSKAPTKHRNGEPNILTTQKKNTQKFYCKIFFTSS